MASLRNFFATVHGSVKGLIAPEELYRSIVTALGSGSVVGLFILVIESVLAHVATVFPAPGTSTLATMLLTLILDLLRRQNQGVTPVKGPVTNPEADLSTPPSETTDMGRTIGPGPTAIVEVDTNETVMAEVTDDRGSIENH
jgi:hypothetical protein